MTPRARAWLVHALRLALGLGLLVLVLWLGGADDIDELDTLRAGPVALAVVATVVLNVAAALRWGLFADALSDGERAAGAGDYVYYTIAARIFGYVLPRDLAEVGSRTVALKRHGLPLSRGIASALLDRAFDVAMLATMLAAALPFWLGWLDRSDAVIVLVAAPLAVGAVFVAAWRPLLALPVGALNLAMRIVYSPRRLRERRPPPLTLDGLTRREAVTAYALSAVKFAAAAGRMVLFAWAFDLPIDAALLVLATPVGQLGYALAFTPGGLGIFDGGWFAILIAGGVSAEHATAMVVGMRVLTLFMLLAIAAAAYAIRTATRTPTR